jgi:hypothetical protein
MIQKPSATGPWMKGRDFAEALTAWPAGAYVFRVADDTERPSYCLLFPVPAGATGPQGLDAVSGAALLFSNSALS